MLWVTFSIQHYIDAWVHWTSQTPVSGVFSWTSQHVAASAADLFLPPTKIWRGCTPYSQTAVRPQTSGPCASSWLDPWFHHAACTSSSHSTSALLHWLLTRKSTILYTLLCNKYFPLLLTPAELSNGPMSLQYAVLTKEISMLAMSHAHSFLNLALSKLVCTKCFGNGVVGRALESLQRLTWNPESGS